MNRFRKMADRRQEQHMVFVERRKGRFWMYGEIAVCLYLIYLLVTLIK